ncbi:DUF5412 family protein [Sporosarcina sp. E16_8]|uniref:DUF5412 family protein n=1 Tax=Sporosarcina sp. E16_8 TaxID=2789295 RepID=UPI002105CAA0|nr:DUF5412 family protein [Sporosarcina sp. E16_8]
MERKYNLWSFISCFFVLMLALQALYASYYGTWQVAPPALTLWLLTVITFVTAIIGFKDKSSRWARWRSWLTVLIVFPLSAIFLLGVAVNTIAREPLETAQSPDSKIIIDFYTLNGGAATSIGVSGVINGPLWFIKRIYYQDHMDRVDVKWTNNHIVTINNHTLNLKKGETFSN